MSAVNYTDSNTLCCKFSVCVYPNEFKSLQYDNQYDTSGLFTIFIDTCNEHIFLPPFKEFQFLHLLQFLTKFGRFLKVSLLLIIDNYFPTWCTWNNFLINVGKEFNRSQSVSIWGSSENNQPVYANNLIHFTFQFVMLLFLHVLHIHSNFIQTYLMTERFDLFVASILNQII